MEKKNRRKTKMPNRPTKEFWTKMEKEVRAGNPDYTDEQVDKVVASIWHKKMGPTAKAKYERIRKRREGNMESEEDGGEPSEQHITGDIKEFRKLESHAKDIHKKVKKLRKKDERELGKSLHFILIDKDTPVPDNAVVLEIEK
jgi:hypothetical protein